MTFEIWFKELTSDERWFEQASMHYKPETFSDVARQIWVNGLADATNFAVIPMREHRRHLFNKLSKLPPDKVKKQWYLKEEDKKDVKPEAPPLVGEARERWLNKWKEALAQTPAFKTTPKLTSQMIEEEGGVRPKAVQPYPATKPSEVYVKQRHLEYIKRNYDAYTKEKLPDWIPEEDFNIQYDNGMI